VKSSKPAWSSVSCSAYSKNCHKVVHELYVRNEIGQEFLFVAMTYAVGSLAVKHIMRI